MQIYRPGNSCQPPENKVVNVLIQKVPTWMPQCWRHNRERCSPQIKFMRQPTRPNLSSSTERRVGVTGSIVGIPSGLVLETWEHHARPRSNFLQCIILKLTRSRQTWNEVGDSYILTRSDLSSTQCSLSKAYECHRKWVAAMLTDLLTTARSVRFLADGAKDLLLLSNRLKYNVLTGR